MAARVRVKPGVLSRQVDGETVLLDRASGRYFQLDAVGSRAWRMFGDGRTIAEVAAELLREFDADTDTIARDLGNLVASLEAAGLVETSHD